MQTVTEHQWKQLMEGMRRRDVGPFVQKNLVRGSDRFRRYYDGRKVVASMRVIDALGPKPGHENERVFKIDSELIEATAYIFIPTQEQLDEWDDAYNDMDSIVEMGKVDPGWLK